MSVLLLVLIASSLLGCQPQQQAIVPVSLEVWDGPRPDDSPNKFAWIEAQIAEFQRQNPHITITLKKMPWQEIVTNLDQQMLAGKWPDVVPLHIGSGGIGMSHLANGLVEAIDPFVDQSYFDDLFPAARQAFSHDGKMYGFPNRMSIHVLLLNLDIFAERGVTPPLGGNWTFAEFSETAQKLTFLRGKDKKPVYGFSTYVQKGYYEVWPFLYMNGARPLSADQSIFTFDTPEAVQALQSLVDLKYKAKAAAPEMGSSDHGGIWYAFASRHERRVAIEAWPDWAIMAATTDPRFKTNIMVARYPTGSSGKPVTIGAAYGFSVLRQPDEHRRKAAMQFAAWLASVPQQQHFASKFGHLPARRSVVTSANFPHTEVWRAASFLDDVELPPRHPRWVQIENSINAQVQAALIGEKTPAQALRDARREVEALLAPPR